MSADGLRWGVEPICTVLTEHGLQIALSTYYAARTRPPSMLAQRHALLLPEVVRVQTSKELGRGLYGARKVWRQLLREDVNIGRGQVETLMRTAGLRGIRRGKQFITTRPEQDLDPTAGPGRPGLHSQPTQRAVDCRFYLRPDLVRDGVHRLRPRRLQPPDRRVAHRRLDAHRATPGRPGDGAVDPHPCGPRHHRRGAQRRRHPGRIQLVVATL